MDDDDDDDDFSLWLCLHFLGGDVIATTTSGGEREGCQRLINSGLDLYL